METILILVAIFIGIGFAAGAVLGTTVASEARRLEKRILVAFGKHILDVEDARDKFVADTKATFVDARAAISKVAAEAEEKRAKLEADARASFDEFGKDVENIVTRLEAIEHNIDVKIASTILPAGKS